MFNIYVKNSQSSSGLIKYRDKDKTISNGNHLRLKRNRWGLFRAVSNFDFKPNPNVSKVTFRQPLIGRKYSDLKIKESDGKKERVGFDLKSTKTPLRQVINLGEDNLPSDRFLDSLEGPSSVKQLRPKTVYSVRLIAKKKASEKKS